jgi:HSP20 family molecular chaperone IbpA
VAEQFRGYGGTVLQTTLTEEQSAKVQSIELFKRRGDGEGSALNDWLTAENALLVTPEADLIESDDKCELHIAVPGFDANDIDVSALPDALIVRAKNAHNHEKTEGNVRFCGGEARIICIHICIAIQYCI